MALPKLNKIPVNRLPGELTPMPAQGSPFGIPFDRLPPPSTLPDPTPAPPAQPDPPAGMQPDTGTNAGTNTGTVAKESPSFFIQLGLIAAVTSPFWLAPILLKGKRRRA